MNRDMEIFDVIRRERERQTKGIELIASENFVSDQVLEAMGSVLTNKYAEGYPGHRYYGGCEVVDIAEDIARDRLKKLYNAEYVNVQPHSGAQANMAVFMACLKAGDTFMGLNLSHGGHLSHGSAVNFSGLMFNAIGYDLNEETGRVDYDDLELKARTHKPKLIIAGASAYSREWDYARIRRVADEIGAIFMVDMAHPAGLIAAGLLDNPLKYAHIVTSTTHKTLRGPRGGIILMGKDFDNPWGKTTPKGEIKKMSALLDSAVFPGTQGGPLEHVIAAKAVAFGEALTDEFKTYQKQVKTNAAVMAHVKDLTVYRVVHHRGIISRGQLDRIFFLQKSTAFRVKVVLFFAFYERIYIRSAARQRGAAHKYKRTRSRAIPKTGFAAVCARVRRYRRPAVSAE